MLRAIAFSIFLLCNFGNAWSNEPEKIKANTGNQPAKYEQRGTENSPIFAHGEVTPKKYKEEARDDTNEGKPKADIDKALVKYTGWLAIFTGLLFMATTALCWVALKQSSDARKTSARQANEMKKALEIAKESADAAQKSAEAADRTARTMEETAQRQLRAHVFPESIDISDIKVSGNVLINIKIKNFGQTPAYKCTCVRRNDLFDFPVSIFPEFKIPPNEPTPSKKDIPPGGFYEASITGMHLSQEERSAVIDGGKAIYVYGEIRYMDAFDIQRTTTFRYMCGGECGVRIGAMYACHEGNDAT